MSIAKKAKEFLKDLLLGSVRPAQRFFLGQHGAQQEITVWLDGMDAPLDVTNHHSMACASPFTICVAFKTGTVLGKQHLRGLSLRFRQRDGNRRLLGAIGLKYSGLSIPTSGPVLYFFQVSSVRSYCLPRIHLWMFYLQFSYRNWRHPLPPNTITLAFLEMRAMEVFFICPRPIGLASAQENSRGNMFPLNVMGSLDEGYLGFGLKDARSPSHLVDRTGRIALSTIPMQHGDLGYKLGPNHSKKNGIDWSDLPFATSPSPKFGIPIPAFAFRVREMEVELARTLGSHIFFVGRVVAEERFSEGVEWCVTHGHYQTWRLKSRPGEIESSIAEDARVKLGMATNNGLI
jgi:flavin reductase (DIM6/NTAB) family NADH-FMN oxidoreductase RutF